MNHYFIICFELAVSKDDSFIERIELFYYIHTCVARGVGAKLEVVRQNFRALSKLYDQN